MIESFGALNGTTLNALPINGGLFRLSATANLNAAVVSSLQATRRIAVVHNGSVVAANSSFNAVRRRKAVSSLTATLTAPVALFRRRRPALGSAIGAATATAFANRRRTALGAGTAAITGQAHLFWIYRLRAPQHRIARLSSATRRAVVRSDQRTAMVPASTDTSRVSKQKREVIAAPTDGGGTV